jgi:two-component system sensor histidine kinase GlrK
VTGPDDLVFLGERLDWMRKQLAEVEKTKAMFVAQVSTNSKPLSLRSGRGRNCWRRGSSVA